MSTYNPYVNKPKYKVGDLLSNPAWSDIMKVIDNRDGNYIISWTSEIVPHKFPYFTIDSLTGIVVKSGYINQPHSLRKKYVQI